MSLWGLRRAAIVERFEAAQADAVELVPTAPEDTAAIEGVYTVIARLYAQLERGDDPRLCEHIDLHDPVVGWWSPRDPGALSCRACHDVAGGVDDGRCDGCRKRARDPVRVWHRVDGVPPAATAESSPPFVVTVLLCFRCRRLRRRR